ncbi:MAG: DUF1810 domain-containing protein [Mesorhizobium sp.]|nr:DUF1810 domain-containing protein [Mesorhizobium sp.]
MTDDPYNLNRFITAQEPVFDIALTELKAGNKRGHWMWFVFPQLRGLGHSPTAQFYGVVSVDEARAYLQHDVLGSRLSLCTQTVLEGQAQSLHDIFGSPDDLKFRSSMILFEAAAPKEDIFGRALDGLCSGKRDERTLYLVKS